MFSTLIAILYGIGLLLSLIGWGEALARAVFPRRRIPWGSRAAWGLALTVVVGGVLNLTQLIYRGILVGYLALGGLMWVASLRSPPATAKPPEGAGSSRDRLSPLFLFASAILLWLVLRQLGTSLYTHPAYSPHLPRFNEDDDYRAYLVFPWKMLELHTMGEDPFSLARMQSLGGQSFLHALVLTLLPQSRLRILDPGIVLVIFAGLLLDLARVFQLSRSSALGLLLVGFSINFPGTNLSSSAGSAALFMALFLALERHEAEAGRSRRSAGIVALIAAALCALRTSNVPACGAMLLIYLLCLTVRASGRRKAVLGEAAACGVIGALGLLPWMISMLRSSGTMLYPLLGKGYHGSAYGGYRQLYADEPIWSAVRFLEVAIMTAPISMWLVLVAVAYGAAPRRVVRSAAWLGFVGGAGLGIATLAIELESYGTVRYSFPFLVASVLVLLAAAAAGSGSEARVELRLLVLRRLAVVAVGVALYTAAYGAGTDLVKEAVFTGVALLTVILFGRWDSAAECWLAALAAGAGAVAGGLIVGSGSGGTGVRPYGFALIGVVGLILARRVWSVGAGRFSRHVGREQFDRLARLGSPIAVVLILVMVWELDIERDLWAGSRRVLKSMAAGLAVPGRDDDAERRNHAMQESIPPASTVLARVDELFRWDLARNRVLLCEHPGGASPPPGMPAFQGPEALAQYLAGRGINYVAYAYADSHATPRSPRDKRYDFLIMQTEDRYREDFEQSFRQLMETRRRIYDDHTTCILDLTARSSATAGSSSSGRRALHPS